MSGVDAILIIAVAFGLYAFTNARAANNLQFFPGNVTGLSIDGINPIATADILIQNTSNVEFTINSFSASVYSNGTLVGNISDFTPDIVHPNSETPYPVTIRFLSLSIIDEIYNAVTTRSIQRNLDIKGTVNANGQQWPVEITYALGL